MPATYKSINHCPKARLGTERAGAAQLKILCKLNEIAR